MQEYYFLFAIALLWTLVATIQDIKKREIANWLNFSLLAFALAYRAFYSVITNNYKFFLLGVLGFMLFLILANVFYYAKAFAGGDAKLLIAYGAILPFSSYLNIILLSVTFLILLFSVGAVYSLLYSIFIVAKNKSVFKKHFKINWKKYRIFVLVPIIIFIILALAKVYIYFSLTFLLISLGVLLYIYTLALDKCMIVLLPPNKLTEGDWLIQDIKLSKNLTIKKTVHGLSKKDISLLKRYNKRIKIKQGIPFVPAFLISLIITGYAFLILEFPFSALLPF